jgi:predicted amidophosphoribosyltransferase
MKQLLNQWLKNKHLLNLSLFKQALFKQYCLLCVASHANKNGLCQACAQDLPWQSTSACPQCGLSANGMVCGSCLHAPTP